MANGVIIEGKGKVKWNFTTQNLITLTVETLCCYIPDCKARLLSPQRLFSKSNGSTRRFIVEEDQTTLTFDGISPLTIEYDSRNHLPAATAHNL